MFYSTLDAYKKSKEYAMIEMLAHANNVSTWEMNVAYHAMVRMLNKKPKKQK